MRLVAVSTLRVAGAHDRGERAMTGVAACFEPVGSVRKAAMAGFTFAVTGQGGGTRRLLLMAASAQGVIPQSDPEAVGGVALRAHDVPVEGVLRCRDLMAATARAVQGSSARRMGIVTTRA